MRSTAQWQVPLPAEFCAEICSSLPSSTRKLATSPVGLPLKLSTSHAAKRYLRSGEKQNQSTVDISAATPTLVSSPCEGFQSNERMPAEVPEATKTRCVLDAAKPLVETVATVAAEADIRKSRRESFRMAGAIFADRPAIAPIFHDQKKRRIWLDAPSLKGRLSHTVSVQRSSLKITLTVVSTSTG